MSGVECCLALAVCLTFVVPLTVIRGKSRGDISARQLTVCLVCLCERRGDTSGAPEGELTGMILLSGYGWG